MTDERVEPTKEWLDALIDEFAATHWRLNGKMEVLYGFRDAILASQPERCSCGGSGLGHLKSDTHETSYRSQPERGEQCEDCDRFYGENGLVWRATDELWRLVGWGERGLLCPDCFTERVKNMGSTPYFAAVDRDTFSRLMAPQVECPDRTLHQHWRQINGWNHCPDCGQSLKGAGE